MLKQTGMILGAVLILQGCSGSSVKENRPANVTSTPSGASVYANGVKIGVTPLQQNLYKVFPAGWSNWEYSATGVLMVKKAGCEDYILRVNDYILSKPIHAELKCTKVVESEEVLPAASDEKKKALAAPVVKSGSAIENRLGELKDLYERGIITQDEYRETRKRILGDI
jgi:hypothetical protein